MGTADRLPLTNDALAELVGANGYHRFTASLTDYTASRNSGRLMQ